MRNLLKGMGSVLNIFGQVDYDAVVPRRSVNDQIALSWWKVGLRLGAAMRTVSMKEPKLRVRIRHSKPINSAAPCSDFPADRTKER